MYRNRTEKGIQILLVSLLLTGLVSGISAVEVELEMTYSSFFGGSGLDLIHSMTVDSVGNIIIAGVTHSTDFPLENAYQDEINEGGDSFLTKLSADGQEVIFSTYIGGSDLDILNHVATDSQDNIIVSGETYSSDYPVLNAYQDQINGEIDCFIMKFDPLGDLQWSTFYGGSIWEVARGIAFDSSDNILFTGHSISGDFPISLDAYQPTLGGEDDVFIVHLSSDGQTMLHSTFLGGSEIEGARHAYVDDENNYVICGLTESTNYPTTADALQSSNGGGADAFISIFDLDSYTLSYSSYFGGIGRDYAWSIGSYLDIGIVVVGYTDSSDFETSSNAYQGHLSGDNDGFIFCLNEDKTLNFSTFIGSDNFDEVRHFAVNPDGTLILVGNSASQDLPASTNAIQPTKDSYRDAFIAVFDPVEQELAYSSFLGGSGYDAVWGVQRTSEIVLCGSTSSSNFPILNPYQEDRAGDSDAFICKLDVVQSGTDTTTTSSLWSSDSLLPLVVATGVIVLVVVIVVYRNRR
ncbi:MAG: hypothetical protein ACXAEF_06980 [Candidatus Thorarchaeota archaeon]